MSRMSLFVLVVLIGAAAVAGLLALTRTSAASDANAPAATAGSQTQIGYRLKQLDAMEADLRRKIAEASKPAPAASRQQQVIVRRAPATVPTSTHDEDDDTHESEVDDESEGRDD